MNTQKVRFVVTVDMPAEMYVNDLRTYMRQAIESWSGQFHPDDPLFGWFYDRVDGPSKRLKIRVIKP